jgi:SEC-C motif-containing protein
MIPDTALCPCGSTKIYDDCCGPFHRNEKRPVKAESLMRSRYSAFVLKLDDYVLSTWDVSNRPKKAGLTESPVEWMGLDVIDCKKGLAADGRGLVEFKAYYKLEGNKYTLHETSRFVKKQGRWFYLDGKVKITARVLESKKV